MSIANIRMHERTLTLLINVTWINISTVLSKLTSPTIETPNFISDI